jgi:hypothetical protein
MRGAENCHKPGHGGSGHGSRVRPMRESVVTWENDVLVFPASGRPASALHSIKGPPVPYWAQIRPMPRML